MQRREKFRIGLSPLYLPIYDGLCADLPEIFQPYCGLRTFVEQDALWMKGRTLPGPVVTAAKGGESPHNYGCATDFAIMDENGVFSWPSMSDPVWDPYVFLVEKLGGRSGESWGDIVHNELKLKVKWREVLAVYEAQGMESAQQFIKENLK